MSDSDGLEVELTYGLGASVLKPLENGLGSGDLTLNTSSRPSPALLEALNTSLEKIDGNSSSRKIKRRNDTEVDAIHNTLSPYHISPAQPYLTESGRLFHAGRLCIILVGLPARGKTHLTVSLTRYLRWLGVKTHPFHMGDYRRRFLSDDDMRDEYFAVNPSKETTSIIQKVFDECMSDMAKFFNEHGGQVAIFDAINGRESERKSLVETFGKQSIRTLFIESLVTDPELIISNVKQVRTCPDYKGWNVEKAVENYLVRISKKINDYQEIKESESLSYIKIINFGQKMTVNNLTFGYLLNRIVFYLLNARIKSGCVYFAREGKVEKVETEKPQANTTTSDKSSTNIKTDFSLSDEGIEYSKTLAEVVLKKLEERRNEERQLDNDVSVDLNVNDIKAVTDESYTDPKSTKSAESLTPVESKAPENINDEETNFAIWTSTRIKSRETAQFFESKGIPINQKSQLKDLNQGDVAGLTHSEIEEKFPNELKKHEENPYHHPFPRGESYHDVAVRMEPLILEMERMPGDLLVIADECVLRVLYGYLMACSVTDIPHLKFPENEIVEVRFNAYANYAHRYQIYDK